eukprot:s79_g7.t1
MAPVPVLALLTIYLPRLIDRAAAAFGHGAGSTTGVGSGVGALVIEEALRPGEPPCARGWEDELPGLGRAK